MGALVVDENRAVAAGHGAQDAVGKAYGYDRYVGGLFCLEKPVIADCLTGLHVADKADGRPPGQHFPKPHGIGAVSDIAVA